MIYFSGCLGARYVCESSENGERNAMFIYMYHNQDNQVQLDNLNTQPTIYSMSCTTNNQLLAPESLVVFITEAQDTIEAAERSMSIHNERVSAGTDCYTQL